MNRALSWISRALSEGDGSPSIKRLLFAVTVVASLAFIAGYLISHGLDANAIDLAKTTLLTTGGAYTAGRFAESREP
jgi:hypothetical protein